MKDTTSRLLRRLWNPSSTAPPRPKGDLEAIRLLHELRSRAGDGPGVDPRTAADLDLDELFRRIDRSTSALGQQRLHDRLRRPRTAPGEFEAFDALVASLPPGGPPEKVRKTLARLGDVNAYLLPYLLFEPLPERPRSRPVPPILTAAAVVCLLASFVAKAFLFPFLFLAAVNIVVRLAFRKRIAPLLHSLPPLRALLQVGKALGRPGSGLPEEVRLRVERAAAPFRKLHRQTSWLAFETEQLDDVTRLAVDYLNFVFLLDVNAYLSSLEGLRRQIDDVRRLHETLGELDAAYSVASFRASLPAWCRQTVPAGAGLRIEGAFHPLLAAPVPVSLDLEGRGVLVTGSNMSGKTTFIKTVGVGALLGSTIATVPARRFEAPAFSVMSAIGRGESLTEGTSYYLGEVRRIRDLLVAAADGRGRPHLFLLDELFRGTNAAERIAAGKAVLAHLASGPNVVLASTHDVELADLLAGRYLPCHFRESLVDGLLVFDHVLYPGPSSTRSALALLAAEGYPDDVVADALRTVDQLGKDGQAPGRTR